MNRYFIEGEDAYWNDISINPYPRGTFEWKEWDEGWDCAWENDNYYDPYEGDE